MSFTDDGRSVLVEASPLGEIDKAQLTSPRFYIIACAAQDGFEYLRFLLFIALIEHRDSVQSGCGAEFSEKDEALDLLRRCRRAIRAQQTVGESHDSRIDTDVPREKILRKVGCEIAEENCLSLRHDIDEIVAFVEQPVDALWLDRWEILFEMPSSAATSAGNPRSSSHVR